MTGNFILICQGIHSDKVLIKQRPEWSEDEPEKHLGEIWAERTAAKKKPKQTFFTISHLHYLFHEYSNNVSFLVNVYQCLYVFLIHLYDELYEQERNWSPIYLKYLLRELKN